MLTKNRITSNDYKAIVLTLVILKSGELAFSRENILKILRNSGIIITDAIEHNIQVVLSVYSQVQLKTMIEKSVNGYSTFSNDAILEQNPSTRVPPVDLNEGLISGLQRFLTGIHSMFTTEMNELVMSVLSIHICLSMLVSGMKGTQKTDIQRALQVDDDILSTSALWKRLNSHNCLVIANGVFVSKGRQLTSEYKTLVGNAFDAEVRSLDLEREYGEVDNWISQKTKGLIKGVITGPLKGSFVLVNTIYFKDCWRSKFDKTNSEDEDFYLFGENDFPKYYSKGGDGGGGGGGLMSLFGDSSSDEESEEEEAEIGGRESTEKDEKQVEKVASSHVVQMMKRSEVVEEYGYHTWHGNGGKDTIEFQSCRLYYENEEFSMVFVKPLTPGNTRGEFSTFERVLLNSEAYLERVLSEQHPTDLKYLQIPKFKLASKFSIKNEILSAPLRNLDLSPILQVQEAHGHHPPFSIEIVHMAKMEVDEEGTVAAAVTIVEALEEACEDEEEDVPEMFVLDRPFLLFIVYDAKVAMFHARVECPVYK